MYSVALFILKNKAMSKMLVTFKYQSQLNINTATNYTNGELIREIVVLLRDGVVELCSYKPIEGEEFDNPCIDDDLILDNETIMEVRLEIIDAEEEERIDSHDGGENLYHYVLDALELGEPEVMYFYTNGDIPMQKSVIGIEIHPAY